MQESLNIAYWYASAGGTFIRMFGREKHMHVLPRFSTYTLVMQEVAYHISIGLSARLYRRKKAPWPALPLRIGLYEIKRLKDADVKAKDIEKFEFGTKDYNPYKPHCICENHYAKVYYPWIHGTFHWASEYPWRYCYNSSKHNELVSMSIEWKHICRLQQ